MTPPAASLSEQLKAFVERMRTDGPRYKSHDLGYVDSVGINTVDDWADDLAALVVEVEALEQNDFKLRARAVAGEHRNLLERLGKSSYAEYVEDDLRTKLAEAQLKIEELEAALRGRDRSRR